MTRSTVAEKARHEERWLPRIVVDLQEQLGRCRNVGELLAKLADGLAPLLPVTDRVSVVFRDADGEFMRIYRVLPRFDGPVGPLPRVRIEGTPVGRVVCEGVGRVSDVRSDSVITLGHASRDGIRSTISVPIRIGGRVVGALNAGSHIVGACTEDMLPVVADIASWIGPAIYAAEQAFSAGERDRAATGGRASAARAERSLDPDASRVGLVGRSAAFAGVVAAARRAARSDADVLITGETGVGKTALARAIHAWSSREGGPFVTVQLTDLSPTIIESELFGHERGAFTGALAARVGRFESAHGGTVFLDEVGEAPLSIQAKLLRVIQERSFERVGGGRTIQADVRIVAATSRRLRELTARGEFREDLFYRLNVVPLHVPPLRDRRDDLGMLVASILERIEGGRGRALSASAWRRVLAHDWPGNIRELECVLRRATILEEGDELELEGFPDESPAGGDGGDGSARWPTLDEHQRQYIQAVLESCGGVIEGASGAALRLGLRPSTLRSRMNRLNISARSIREKGRDQ